MRLRIISHNGRTAKHATDTIDSLLQATRALSAGGWAVLESNEPEHVDCNALAFFHDSEPVYIAEQLTIGERIN